MQFDAEYAWKDWRAHTHRCHPCDDSSSPTADALSVGTATLLALGL